MRQGSLSSSVPTMCCGLNTAKVSEASILGLSEACTSDSNRPLPDGGASMGQPHAVPGWGADSYRSPRDWGRTGAISWGLSWTGFPRSRLVPALTGYREKRLRNIGTVSGLLRLPRRDSSAAEYTRVTKSKSKQLAEWSW